MKDKNNKKCRICGMNLEEVLNEFYPFCGKNCQTKDLGNWVYGNYRIPVSEMSSTSEESENDEFDNN